MERYEIVFSEQANTDIQNLSDAIMYQYEAPLTAFRYVQGLIDEIKTLKTNADTFSIQKQKPLFQYGSDVRRLNYKKMAIIYAIIDRTVYIVRIVPSSTIRV
ncbi:MAG: type II toxin-antitoxin system RelE/ParE family toxin [Paludibacter sp.]|nr:type II toxin-antitoxin system RelE/ParE family toxin [Paludibacter sp.]